MKLKLTIASLFIVIYGVFFYTNTKTKNERIAFDLNKQIKNLENNYDLVMDYFLIDAKSIRINISNNKKAIALFSQALNATPEQKNILRDKLYKILKPLYTKIHLRGILQWQFVFPNNISFLRMNNPTKFGDDLTNIRYSFMQVNKTKKTIIDFEQGRTVHAFRYAFPFYNKKGGYIGAMEISLASNILQEKLSNINKIHLHFLINKKIFDAKAWKIKDLEAQYLPSIEHKDYLIALSKNSSLSKLLDTKDKVISKLRDKIDNGILSKKPFSLYIKYNDTVKVVAFLPIKNKHTNKIVAYIVSYTNSNNIKNISNDYNSSNVIVFFVLLILFYFIYRVINQKEILDMQVKEKTKILVKINRELEESEEELKIINENLAETIKNEVKKNQDKDRLVFQQSKMVSMGEMIGNIAHQWRQPLSVISTASTGILMQKEYGLLTDDLLKESCTAINNNAQYLSKTIDDFRNFIKGGREKTIFSLKDSINSFLHLVEGTIKSNNINIILDLHENIKIDGYENELTQCLINIFNNAKDALKELSNEKDRLIFISTSNQDSNIIIKIKDNGGGIPEDILPKIFDPYFTTKHKSQGTGLGLNMTYNLIVDGMGGTIDAINVEYKYKDKDYKGVEFIIKLSI